MDAALEVGHHPTLAEMSTYPRSADTSCRMAIHIDRHASRCAEAHI